jgi:hypothetical protein
MPMNALRPVKDSNTQIGFYMKMSAQWNILLTQLHKGGERDTFADRPAVKKLHTAHR